MILSDQKRFKQILFNLIGNAAKFTFKGFINIRVWFSESKLFIEVEDSGIGMKEDEVSKLF